MRGIECSFLFDDWFPLGTLMEVTGSRGIIDMGISIEATMASVLHSHRRRRHRLDHFNNIQDAIDSMRGHRCSTYTDVHLWIRTYMAF